VRGIELVFLKASLEIYGMGLATAHAFVAITFQTGNFEESGEAVNLYLPVTLWLDRCSSEEPAFFLNSARGQTWEGERRCGTWRIL
jgi:hypothetical protein